MDQVVTVELSGRAYPVVVGGGALGSLGARAKDLAPSGVAVVTDEIVASLWGQQVMESLAGATAGARRLFAVPPGEAAKTPERLAALWNEFAAAGFDRNALVVALGGGVVGDLAGFAAACFLRGLRWAQIPTTLLAQVDSSVGGKTGVNLPAGKNLAGAFHQPVFVLADPATLSTLPSAEWSCGFAEAVKHGAALDADYFAALEADADALARARAAAGPGRPPPRPPDEAAATRRLVSGSCRIKAGIVARDEREVGGERALLNFGHSFGHAYEKLSGFRLRHGEAVARGMRVALRLSERLTGLSPAVRGRVEVLLARLGVPAGPMNRSPEEMLDAMRGDKKNEGGGFRLVLLEDLGRACVLSLSGDALFAELRREAL